MGVPAHMQPHTGTLQRATVSTDAYNNEVLTYTDLASIRSWLQQDTRTEPHTDGRDPLVQTMLLVTNEEDIRGRDRYVQDGITYEVEGPPEKVYTPSGFHHSEATLRVVTG